MKKLVLLLVILFMPLAYAIDDTAETIEKMLQPLAPLIEKAQKTNNPEDWIKASIAAYKLDKKELSEVDRNEINNKLVSRIVMFNLKRYETTNNKKFVKRAYRWTKRGVNNKTTDVYTISYDIILASSFLDKKEMIRAYDWLTEVNPEEAQKGLSVYKDLLEQTERAIADKSVQNKQKLRSMLYYICVGMSGAARGYSNGLQRSQTMYNNSSTNRPVSTYTQYYTVGNQLHSYSTSY